MVRLTINGVGGSLIVSREGGHNQPAPPGLECYLPYQISVVKSAGSQPDLIVVTRNTAPNGRNRQSSGHHGRMRIDRLPSRERKP